MLLRKILGTFAIVLLTATMANADLDGYMDSLRISADADFGDFRAGLGAHFGASGAELDHVFLAVGHPSEAALCFWLARTSGRPMDVVLQQYRVHKKQGWGALAQSLGIKPGSAEFKALKAGQIGWEPPGGHGKSGGADDHKQKNGKDTKNHSSKDKGAKDKGKKN
jgi:hypothetical protein